METPPSRPSGPIRDLLTCDGVGTARKEALLRQLIAAGSKGASAAVIPYAGGNERTDGAATIQKALLAAFGLKELPADTPQGYPRSDFPRNAMTMEVDPP